MKMDEDKGSVKLVSGKRCGMMSMSMCRQQSFEKVMPIFPGGGIRG